MLGIIMQALIGLLCFSKYVTMIINTPGHTKCISLNNQQCMTQSTLINFHPNKYIEVLCYYPFVVNLDRCMTSCNAYNDLSNRLCVSNKTGDSDLNVFNTITGIRESKVLTKRISCECKCKFNSSKCNWFQN